MEFLKKIIHTVDGSEIRRSPVEVGSLSHYLRRFLYIPGGDRQISGPSTVGSSFKLHLLSFFAGW